MSQQFINIGYVVNDGTGDTLRDAFEKVNGNFNQLFTSTLSGTSTATPNTVVRRDSAGGAAFLALEFKNEYATPSGFPAAASHTGMVAFAVSTGKEYYSNGSQWLQLSGALSTTELPEGINLYFTNARARSAIGVSGPAWVQFDRSTGIISFSDLSVTNISNAASTTYVDTSINTLKNDILDGVGSSLDTLKELATAINNDPAFFQTIAGGLAGKANIASPAFTGVATAPTATQGTNTTQLATTAFVAAAVAAKDNTDEITEGATNLYFTTARARAAIGVSGDLSYNPTTGIISFTATPSVTSFNDLTDKPTSISGYGITDAYTKSEIDTALTNKVSNSVMSSYYTKSDVNTLLSDKADASDVYNKTEVYTQNEVDVLIASSLSSQPETYTKAEVWNLLLNINNRLNEAGIQDILGSLTAPVVVDEDWGSITDTIEMPEDYGNLSKDIAY